MQDVATGERNNVTALRLVAKGPGHTATVLNSCMKTITFPNHANAAERLKLINRISRALQTSLKQIERAKQGIAQELSTDADA